MTLPTIPTTGPVDVALDLRELKIKVENKRELLAAWRNIACDLIGKPITPGQWLEQAGPTGHWKMLVLDPRGVTVIGDDTLFNVVDLGRNPEIRHACKECQKESKTTFGPFFCPDCREQKLPDRLCEAHAHFLENKFMTYCQEHLPRCQCRKDCPDPSTFECDRCHKPFAEKWKRKHPNDPLMLLCSNCYAFQFEICAECKREGRKRLGKSRCAFPTGIGDERHGERLCTLRHARQWQIWGPHWRGVILCEEHYRRLAQATPADLLWMLVAARAPAPFLRGKVTDVYRLRNIVGYVRRQELPWPEMERTLRTLAIRAAQPDVPRFVRENIEQLLDKIGDVQADLPVIEAELLARVRDFYRSHLRVDPATAVLGVSVKRVFGRKSEPQTCRIAIRVGRDVSGRSMTGLLIGKGGTLVNQLKAALKLQGVDFEE